MSAPRRRRGSRVAPDAGMVTVELALGFLVVAVVLALVVSVAAAGLTRSSLCHAVREVAREAAVGGEDPDAVVGRTFGPGAQVSVARQGGWVHVSGSAELRGPGDWVGMQATCAVTTLDETAIR